jgi:hypothetical protein
VTLKALDLLASDVTIRARIHGVIHLIVEQKPWPYPDAGFDDI